MDPSQLLRYLVSVLESQGHRYLVTGSVAGTYYGEPRFTNDIDVVVILPLSRVVEFCRSFPAPHYYVNPDTVREAIELGGQFNIIHPESGLKIDVISAGDTPFDRSRFTRTHRVRPEPDYEASFASKEDVILKKLEYFRQGSSQKHLRDIASIIKISGDELDRGYLDEWARQLAVEKEWEQVLSSLQDH